MPTDPFSAAMFFNVVNCLSFLIFFALLLGFIGFLRYLSYRETIALAEKGLVRSEEPGKRSKNALRWGIIVIAIGLALMVGLYPLGFIPGNSAEFMPLRLGPWMVIGFVPTFLGLGLILIHFLTREKPNTNADKKDEGTR